jgi:chromosome segregation ATPase
MGCAPNREVAITSAQPAISRIEMPLVAASDATSKIKESLSVAQKELAQRRLDAETFKAQLESYKAQGKSIEEQLDITWRELNKQFERNLFLENSLADTSKEVGQLENSLISARSATQSAMDIAKQLDAQTLAQSQTIAELRRDLSKAEKQAANAKVYKFWIIVGAIGLAVLWLLREIVPRVLRFI